jgi:hypothetical protein
MGVSECFEAFRSSSVCDEFSATNSNLIGVCLFLPFGLLQKYPQYTSEKRGRLDKRIVFNFLIIVMSLVRDSAVT